MIDLQDPSGTNATPATIDQDERGRPGPDAANDSVGARLRSAREARGLSVAECAEQLHLPVRVLERLEAEDFGAPEHFVFLRGALQGYARFLGLPGGCCDSALRAAAPDAQPALVSVARTTPARWLLQRYGTAAVYIVLTAFIAVPLVVIGLRGGLERPSTRMVSLDHASAAAQPAAQHKTPAQAGGGASNESPDSTPFRASIAPFSAMGLSDADTPETPLAAAPTTAGAHALELSATADCWFRITDAQGDEVASGMLHAGDVRTWHANGPLHVTLGNASGVAVTEDGKPVDLDAFRHANVARLDLFGPAAGGTEND